MIGQAVGLAISVGGAVLAVAEPVVYNVPWANVILFIGGIAMSLAGIGVFIRYTGKGVAFMVRATDGLSELVGDPKAHPPILALPERVGVLEEGQAEILAILRTLQTTTTTVHVESTHAAPPPSGGT